MRNKNILALSISLSIYMCVRIPHRTRLAFNSFILIFFSVLFFLITLWLSVLFVNKRRKIKVSENL